MKHKETITWFVRSFALTALVLLLILSLARPTLGAAQEYPQNPNWLSQASSSDEPPQPYRSDDPLQRTPMPVPDVEALPGSNVQAVSPSIAAPLGGGPSEPIGPGLYIPGAEFSSDGGNGAFFFDFTGGYVQGPTSGVSACLKAPAYLPRNAYITSMWASLYDNDGSYNVAVFLRRIQNYTGVHNEMASVVSVSFGTSIQTPYDDTILYPAVVYPDYSYYVTTCLSSNLLRLYSVRIYYTLGGKG